MIFYPGQKILIEGTNKVNKMFIIVEGECNLVCTKTNDKFTNLENIDDPTKAEREKERR